MDQVVIFKQIFDKVRNDLNYQWFYSELSVSRVRPGTGRALLPLPAGVGDSVRQPVALF